MLLLLRFVIALIFIVSGIEKLISPRENFLYVLQAYEVFPDLLESVASMVFPWIELGIGVFLALGLWLRLAAAALACMSGSLVVVVAQASSANRTGLAWTVKLPAATFSPPSSSRTLSAIA